MATTAENLLSRFDTFNRLGISERQFDRLVKNGTLPAAKVEGSRYWFDFDATRKRYWAYKAKVVEERQEPLDKLQAVLRLTQQTVRKVALDYDQERHSCVLADDVRRDWSTARQMFIDALHSEIEPVARQLVDVQELSQVSRIINSHFRTITQNVVNDIQAQSAPSREYASSRIHVEEASEDREQLSIQIDSARALLYGTQADLKSLRSDLRVGRQFRSNDVREVIRGYLLTMRTRLQLIGGSLPRLFVGHQDWESIASLLDKYVGEAIDALPQFNAEEFKADDIDYVGLPDSIEDEDSSVN